MEFTVVQMDALQELANIGSAHSATTLSQMLNTNIGMSVPKIWLTRRTRPSPPLSPG